MLTLFRVQIKRFLMHCASCTSSDDWADQDDTAVASWKSPFAKTTDTSDSCTLRVLFKVAGRGQAAYTICIIQSMFTFTLPNSSAKA